MGVIHYAIVLEFFKICEHFFLARHFGDYGVSRHASLVHGFFAVALLPNFASGETSELLRLI
jgi:hypothetical protein